MRKEVEEFLNGRTREEAEGRQRRREKHLIELGLFRTEFLEDALKAGSREASPQLENEYPYYEEGRRCRRAALEVTDEEYAAICEKAPEAAPAKWPPVWPVRKMLSVLAFTVYGMGAVIGLGTAVSGMGYGGSGAVFLAALNAMVLYAVGGTLLLAVSELVRLMEKKCGEL